MIYKNVIVFQWNRTEKDNFRGFYNMLYSHIMQNIIIIL